MMEYKGYLGHVEYDDEADLFHGDVVNTRDVITFQGTSTNELKKAFHDSVDVYLDYCKRKNRGPDKPFSGKFLVRVSPEQHRLIYLAAKNQGMSLNSWVSQTFDEVMKKAA